MAGLVWLRLVNCDRRFKYETKDELPHHFRADRKRLRQVLINLLGNAIEFTDRGRKLLPKRV